MLPLHHSRPVGLTAKDVYDRKGTITNQPATLPMPIYEYKAGNETSGCPYCRDGFECLRKLSDPPLESCPQCGSVVVKLISAPSVGLSRAGLDDRARGAGFHKLKRLGKGEYEKKY